MPGQLNLTGANAAIQLVGNDTITTDQEFVFPDTGGTVVTDDFDGDVEIDGDITVTGSGLFGDADNNYINVDAPGGALTVVSDITSGNVIQYGRNGEAALFSVSNDGGATFVGGRARFVSDGNLELRNGSDTVASISAGDGSASLADEKVTISGTGKGRFDTRSATAPAIQALSNASEASDAPITAYNGNSNGGFLFVGYGPSNDRKWYIDNSGNTGTRNVLLQLDPDDETKVLDVKESIRTMQSALYRLKAAVLIPNASVDEMRLRILEALETITEEVD